MALSPASSEAITFNVKLRTIYQGYKHGAATFSDLKDVKCSFEVHPMKVTEPLEASEQQCYF